MAIRRFHSNTRTFRHLARQLCAKVTKLPYFATDQRTVEVKWESKSGTESNDNDIEESFACSWCAVIVCYRKRRLGGHVGKRPADLLGPRPHVRDQWPGAGRRAL